VVQKLKRGSSKKVRDKFPDLKEFVWGDGFWCDGYFALIVAEVEEKIVKKYIKGHHDSSMPT
jgi:REP element-mobilizing transposase RayT